MTKDIILKARDGLFLLPPSFLASRALLLDTRVGVHSPH